MLDFHSVIASVLNSLRSVHATIIAVRQRDRVGYCESCHTELLSARTVERQCDACYLTGTGTSRGFAKSEG